MQQERERREQSQTLIGARPRALQELEQEQARRPLSEDVGDVEIARLKEQVSKLRRQSSRFPQPPEEQNAQVEQRRAGVSRNRASVGSFETVQQDEGPNEASGLQEEGHEWSSDDELKEDEAEGDTKPEAEGDKDESPEEKLAQSLDRLKDKVRKQVLMFRKYAERMQERHGRMLQTNIDMEKRLVALENWDGEYQEPEEDKETQEFAGNQSQEFAGNWPNGTSGVVGTPMREPTVGDVFGPYNHVNPKDIPGSNDRRAFISPGPYGTASQGKGSRGIDESSLQRIHITLPPVNARRGDASAWISWLQLTDVALTSHGTTVKEVWDTALQTARVRQV